MKLFNFLSNIFNADKPESSKRFFGSIGFISSIVFIGLWEHELIDELMYVSAMLIGLETVTKLFKK